MLTPDVLTQGLKEDRHVQLADNKIASLMHGLWLICMRAMNKLFS